MNTHPVRNDCVWGNPSILVMIKSYKEVVFVPWILDIKLHLEILGESEIAGHT